MQAVKYSDVDKCMIAFVCSYLDAVHPGFFDDWVYYGAKERLHYVELCVFRIENSYVKRVRASNFRNQRDRPIGNVSRRDSATSRGDVSESGTFRACKRRVEAEEA